MSENEVFSTEVSKLHTPHDNCGLCRIISSAGRVGKLRVRPSGEKKQKTLTIDKVLGGLVRVHDNTTLTHVSVFTHRRCCVLTNGRDLTKQHDTRCSPPSTRGGMKWSWTRSAGIRTISDVVRVRVTSPRRVKKKKRKERAVVVEYLVARVLMQTSGFS